MTRLLLGAASVLALMAIAPAFAEEKSSVLDVTKQKVVNSVEAASDAAAEAAVNASKAMEETYEDIKASLIDKNEKVDVSVVTVNSRYTANGMIGRTIYNWKGEGVGKVHDIILDRQGNPAMVIVADGEIFGMGKKVAFDYGIVTTRDENGDVIAPISENMIDKRSEFSYDPKDASATVRVLPSDGYSVNALLDGQLVDPGRTTVADIDNIVFRNGKAALLIVSFDKILGMGGDKAAVAFGDATIVKDGDDAYDFQLSAPQAARFETFKKAVK